MASKPGLVSSEPTTTAEKAKSTGQNLKDKAGDAAASAKQSISEAGRRAAEQVDSKREPAANTLENAAATMHEKAESLPGGESVKSAAHTAAEKVQATAGYIRQHDVQSMLSDVENMVRRNPGPSLLVAAAIGFLIGRAFHED